MSASVNREEQVPQGPGRALGFLALCFYPLIWLMVYAWLQAAISWSCSSLSIDVFSPLMIKLRISACFISGVLVMLFLVYRSLFVKRLIFYMVPIWFVGYCFSGLTTGAINYALGFVVSRPVNDSAPSAAFHQGEGYYPCTCPAEVNADITAFLRKYGEEDRYAPLVPGFVCRLVVRDEQGQFSSYRVESQESFGTRLFVAGAGQLNGKAIPLNSSQVEAVRGELAVINRKMEKKALASWANCLYLEYQIGGQYYYVAGRPGGVLDGLEKLLVAGTVGNSP